MGNNRQEENIKAINGWLSEIGSITAAEDLQLNDRLECFYLSAETFPTILKYDPVINDLVLCTYISDIVYDPSLDLLSSVLSWNYLSSDLNGASIGLCQEKRRFTMTVRTKLEALDKNCLYNLIQNFSHTNQAFSTRLAELTIKEEVAEPRTHKVEAPNSSSTIKGEDQDSIIIRA